MAEKRKFNDIVVEEFKKVGRNRSRLMAKTRDDDESTLLYLDIREFVEEIDSFTRKGIRVMNEDQAKNLIEALTGFIRAKKALEAPVTEKAETKRR